MENRYIEVEIGGEEKNETTMHHPLRQEKNMGHLSG